MHAKSMSDYSILSNQVTPARYDGDRETGSCIGASQWMGMDILYTTVILLHDNSILLQIHTDI